MKYVIRGEKEGEKPVEVWLEMRGEGCPTLRMCDKNGRVWNIAQLLENGTLYLFGGISPAVGLQVDGRGRIIVE